MLQCEQCEFCRRDEKGRTRLTCDPFATIKEPECLLKWQVVQMEQMVAAYQATLSFYNRIAPMQEKMFKVIEREIDDIDEAEKWKLADDDDEDDDDDDAPAPW